MMPQEIPGIGVVDDGVWEDCCHDTADGKLPVCGNPNALHCVSPGKPRSRHLGRCPWCERPICRACCQIQDNYEKTGAWEGSSL